MASATARQLNSSTTRARPAAPIVVRRSGSSSSAAIAGLLDDPERRTAMGAAGRARVEEMFSWRAVAEATAAAYEETIADFQEENHRADR